MGWFQHSRFGAAGLALISIMALLTGWRFQEPAPKGASVQGFSAVRARDVLRRVLPDATPHPLVTQAQSEVRARILRELSALGFEPEGETVSALNGVSSGRRDDPIAKRF